MKAVLYVKGVKTANGVVDRSHWRWTFQLTSGGKAAVPPLFPDYRVDSEAKYKSMLPEDQKALVEMVKAAAVKYGFELTVIDVTESARSPRTFLHKLGDRLKGINTFPALVTDRGLKIEGDITEERIKALLAKQKTN